VLGQNGHLAEDQRQLPIAGFLEVKTYSLRAFYRDCFDVSVVVPEEGVPLGSKRVEGEFHILSGNGFAIVEPRLFTDIENHIAPVFGCLQGFGNQAVGRKGLIVGRLKECVIQIVADARGGNTPDIKRIE